MASDRYRPKMDWRDAMQGANSMMKMFSNMSPSVGHLSGLRDQWLWQQGYANASGDPGFSPSMPMNIPASAGPGAAGGSGPPAGGGGRAPTGGGEEYSSPSFATYPSPTRQPLPDWTPTEYLSQRGMKRGGRRW